MSAPLFGSRVLRALALVLTSLLAATLLGGVPASAGGRDTARDTTRDSTRDSTATPPPAPRLEARGDLAGYDAPVLPPGCFGPARSGIDPFPCPLNKYRPRLPTILLWGDSHAYEWIPALREAVRGERVNLVSFVAGSCPPVLITRDLHDGACRRSNYVALRTVEALVREKARFKVVLGSNWSGFRRAYRRVYLESVTGVPSGYDAYTTDMIRLAHEGTPDLFTRLGRMGVDVDIIGQAATVPERRPSCPAGDAPYNCDLPRWRALPEERRTVGYLHHQQDKITVRGRSRLIDATPGYCTATVCHGKIGAIETYFDDLHLSATRTRALARFFKPAVRDLHRR
ncbi:SGNH hydrolase domain-containing protein [Nocardioides rubriscoriae]|uniref:SGNH hydrolase domain-containing protein n=1 Tax=Nocardioides rubriscoriae TaxID=642762 RepID=UPI0011DF916C|nr:SGNH hydrolase domain-containing protein [Nocardioides rubriscoriae]